MFCFLLIFPIFFLTFVSFFFFQNSLLLFFCFFNFFCFYVFLKLSLLIFKNIELIENLVSQFFKKKHCGLLQCFSHTVFVLLQCFPTCLFFKIIFVEFIFSILSWLRIQLRSFFKKKILWITTVFPRIVFFNDFVLFFSE